MTAGINPKSYIEVVDQQYRDAVFEALMNYQALEDLLKKCISKSYEILDSTSHKTVTYNPPKKLLQDIEKTKGLGGLAEYFRVVTPHKDICDRIKAASRTRNTIAHSAAADFLKMKLSEEGAKEWHSKAVDFNKAADEANKLYFELIDVFQEILAAHNDSF